MGDPSVSVPDPERPFEAPFYGKGWSPNDQLLARSSNFTLRSSFGHLRLEGRGLGEPISVGNIDFQDDFSWVYDAAINESETWCVAVGRGFSAYAMGHPWENFEPEIDSSQWWLANEPFLWEIAAINDDQFLADNPQENWVMRRYSLQPASRVIEVVDEWVDFLRGERGPSCSKSS